MKHKVAKFKIKNGVDANTMLLKKLVRNFAVHGTLKTTAVKARYVKSLIERLSHDALDLRESTRNTILSYLGTPQMTHKFAEEVKMRTVNQTGSGIVKIVKLGRRPGDAVPVSQLVWTKQIETKTQSKKSKDKTKS